MGQVVVGLSYFNTLGGRLKLLEIALNIIAGCLVGTVAAGAIRNFFISATVIGTIISVIILVFHLFKLLRTDPSKNEFLGNLIFALYYLAACIVIINAHKPDEIYTQVIFGEIFGVLGTVSYLIDAGYCFWLDPFCFKR